MFKQTCFFVCCLTSPREYFTRMLMLPSLWRAETFTPMPSTLWLWAGRDLYCAKPGITQGLGFLVSSEGLAPISPCFTTATGKWEKIYSNPNSGLVDKRLCICLIVLIGNVYIYVQMKDNMDMITCISYGINLKWGLIENDCLSIVFH